MRGSGLGFGLELGVWGFEALQVRVRADQRAERGGVTCGVWQSERERERARERDQCLVWRDLDVAHIGVILDECRQPFLSKQLFRYLGPLR